MRHDEFEAKMFSRVNENSKMKELDREEVARAAAEEYRYVSKCKKINAVIGIIVLTLFFGTTVFALQALNLTGYLPSAWAIGVMAVMGLAFGMGIHSLGYRTKY